jgi:hypothetical protein
MQMAIADPDALSAPSAAGPALPLSLSDVLLFPPGYTSCHPTPHTPSAHTCARPGRYTAADNAADKTTREIFAKQSHATAKHAAQTGDAARLRRAAAAAGRESIRMKRDSPTAVRDAWR